MKNHWKEVEGDFMHLWHTLVINGFDPIRPQFDFLKEQGSGATLNSVRNTLRNYMEDEANFNPDGTLKNIADLFPICLYVKLPKDKEVGAPTTIDFSIYYSQARRFYIPSLSISKVYDTEVFTEIDAELKPGYIPKVKSLNTLVNREDEKRITNQENIANRKLYLSSTNVKLGRRGL